MKILVCVAALIALSGCATTAPQTQTLLRAPPRVAPAVEIPDVPFIDQTSGHCGPATLTMALLWNGHRASVDEMAPKVMTPGKSGSLQQDMITAARREGFVAVPIAGMEALVREIASGHPVIVFENVGLSWLKQWHYALVYGYDLGKGEFILHSGHDAADRIDMAVFERSWKLGDYWGLVVVKPGEIAETGGELANMQAAAALEKLEFLEPAKATYERVLARWPESVSALLGLGNVSYKQKKFSEAVGYLRKARDLQPESMAIAQNLRVAEAALAGERKD